MDHAQPNSKEISIELVNIDSLKITTDLKKKILFDSYERLLKDLFPDYNIENNQHLGQGVADFRLIPHDKEKEEVWVEIKRNLDGLNQKQLEWADWMLNTRKNKKVKVLFIK